MRQNRLVEWARWIFSAVSGRVVLPVWIAIGIAIFLGIPAWNDAVHFWLNTAKTTPTWAAATASIILNPYFSPGLALFGIIYLFIVGYEGTNIVRHKIVPVIAWIVVGLCFIVVFLTTGYGWLELALRRAYDEGASHVAREGTPSENSASHPQHPLTSKSRILEPDQERILLQELPKLRQYSKTFLLASTPSDGETYSAITRFMPLLVRSGINPELLSLIPQGPEMQGFIIAVLAGHPIPEICVQIS